MVPDLSLNLPGRGSEGNGTIRLKIRLKILEEQNPATSGEHQSEVGFSPVTQAATTSIQSSEVGIQRLCTECASSFLYKLTI